MVHLAVSGPKLLDLVRESRTSDAFKTIADVVLGYNEIGAINDDLGLSTVRMPEVNSAFKLGRAMAQEWLASRYPEQMTVYRKERTAESGRGRVGVIAVESYSLRPVDTFTNPNTYRVARKDILFVTEAMFPYDGPGEYEVLIESTKVTLLATATVMAARRGDGWFVNSDGVERWGRYGAAGVLFRYREAKQFTRFLVQHRGLGVDEGGTWGLPGGALDENESPERGAIREAAEEIGHVPSYRVVDSIIFAPAEDWSYTTIIADVDELIGQSGAHTWESQDLRWVTYEEMQQLPLHPGLRSVMQNIQRYAVALASASDTLVVYHGTTKLLAEQYLSGQHKVDPQGFLREIAERFDIDPARIKRHPLYRDGWWGDRTKRSDFDYVYVTTDYTTAESYAQAGTAPLYDLLSIVYMIMFPERKKDDFFGATYTGFNDWVKRVVVDIGGGPAVLEFHLGWEALTKSFTWHERARMRGPEVEDMDAWKEWQLGRNLRTNDAEIAFLRNAPDLWNGYVRTLNPPMPEGRIITRNGKLAMAAPLYRGIDIYVDADDIMPIYNNPLAVGDLLLRAVLSTPAHGGLWGNSGRDEALGLGRHWVADHDKARRWAMGGNSEKRNNWDAQKHPNDGGVTFGIPIVFAGSVAMSYVRTDDEVLHQYQMAEAETEVPIEDGAPIHLVAIEAMMPDYEEAKSIYEMLLAREDGPWSGVQAHSHTEHWETYPVNRTVTAAWTEGPFDSSRCTETVLNQFGIFGEAPRDGLGVLETLMKNGWTYRAVDPQFRGTVKAFCEQYPTGKYYFASFGHAMALIDGLLVDAEGKGPDNRRVIGAFEVYRPGERTATTFGNVRLLQILHADEAHKVQPELERMAARFHGKLGGIDFQVKNLDSILEKIDRKSPGSVDWRDAGATVKDILRYTVLLPPDTYGTDAQKLLYAMEEAGYLSAEPGENSWARGDVYSGLHYTMVSPRGFVFELQIHTDASFHVKNDIIHRDYEQYRDPKTPTQERQKLYDNMTRAWDDVPVPFGAAEFGLSDVGRPGRGTNRNVFYQRPAHLLPRTGSVRSDWPFAKVAVAPNLVVREYEGREGDKSHLTRGEMGTLPTYMVAHMPGKNGEVPGEHRNRLGDAWTTWLADIKANGIQSALLIIVDWDGHPLLYEGNHRRDAAVELGLESVPVDIRYFGHAQRQGTVAERMSKTSRKTAVAHVVDIEGPPGEVTYLDRAPAASIVRP